MNETQIILSIRPEHANNILDGRKTVELRRRFPANAIKDSLILIYSSSPDQALIGAAKIKQVKRMTTSALWKDYCEQAYITKQMFNDYFSGVTEGYGVVLGCVARFEEAISISELKARFNFSPPQSYCYVRGALTGLMNDDRIQVPDRHEHPDRTRRQSSSGRRAH